MGPCILRIFQYISTQIQRYTVYLYLGTALHVSGGTSTHHQEGIQLYLQHLVFVTPLLPPAAIAVQFTGIFSQVLGLEQGRPTFLWQTDASIIVGRTYENQSK
jgi:hypothetical protein